MVATDDQYRASHCRKLAQESGEERHGFCRRVTAIINITGYQDDLRLLLTDKKAESVVTAAAQEISEGKVVIEEEK